MLTIIKNLLKYSFQFFIAAYLLIWVASPTIVQYYISDYLKSYQLVLSNASSIRYNPFMAHLSIRDLKVTKISNTKQPVFSVKKLDLEVRLYQLFLEDVYVSEFVINGLNLKIKTMGEILEVAGIEIPMDAEPEDEKVETPTENTTPFPFRLNMPELTLKNANFDFSIDGSPHSIKLKNFVITDFGATLASQNLLLQIDSEVNQSSLSLGISANMDKDNGHLFVDLNLSKVKLARFKHFLPESVTKFEGLASYSGKHTIDLKDGNISIAIKELSLMLEDVDVAQFDHHLALDQKQFESSHLLVVMKSDDSLLIEGAAELSLDNFKTFYKSEEQILAAFENLNFSSIKFSSPEGINTVAVGNVKLSKAFFSDNIKDKIPALAQLSALNIKQTTLTAEGISIDEINLAGLEVDAQLNKKKVLLNMVDMGLDASNSPSDTTDKTTAPLPEKTEESTKKNNFNISLGKFKLADDINIHFTDNSVKPRYKRHVSIKTLNAGPFNTRQPEKKSPFSILGKSEKYANFKFKGNVKPFASIPAYHLKGFFKEVSLPGISAYIKDALQYEIQSGQLDLDLDVTVTGDKIDGDADVLLRGIKLTAADDHESGSVKDKTSVPFNIALGMLKDGDGNVELSLPLDGDTSNPSFGMSGFMTLLIKQATMAAAKDYLMTAFVPYASVVSIGIAAGKYALKIRFNDMVYPPGAVDLQPEQKEFLSQFAALLRDKKDVQVKLCPVATAADINKPTGVEITDKADIKKLKDISTKRVNAFKDFMVKKEKIGSSRLLLCTPQINSNKEAKPSLTFET